MFHQLATIIEEVAITSLREVKDYVGSWTTLYELQKDCSRFGESIWDFLQAWAPNFGAQREAAVIGSIFPSCRHFMVSRTLGWGISAKEWEKFFPRLRAVARSNILNLPQEIGKVIEKILPWNHTKWFTPKGVEVEKYSPTHWGIRVEIPSLPHFTIHSYESGESELSFDGEFKKIRIPIDIFKEMSKRKPQPEA